MYRRARFVWWILVAFLVLWAMFYFGISDLACSWAQPGSNCGARPPWELGPGDFDIMFFYPMIIAVLIAGVALLVGFLTKPHESGSKRP